MAWHFSRAGGWKRQEFQCHHCKAHRLHQKYERNCKYFPQEWQSRARPCWIAKVGDKQKERSVPGTAITECPVSFVTSQSLYLLELEAYAKTSKEYGGAMFGHNALKWPAWYFDTIATVARAEMAELKGRQ